MTSQFKSKVYDYNLVGAFVLMLLIFSVWVCVDSLRTSAFLFSFTGGVLGLSYSILKQHLEETRLFKELFSDFNKRYDSLNGPLHVLISIPVNQSLTLEQKITAYDYFNLCAEEYLFYRKGYIYPEVWIAWSNGMKIIFNSPQIRELWNQESKTDSYYGFTPPS